MWDRKELKSKGKAAFKANYWKCVLVAFLMLILLGGGLSAAKSQTDDLDVNWNMPPDQHTITPLNDSQSYLAAGRPVSLTAVSDDGMVSVSLLRQDTLSAPGFVQTSGFYGSPIPADPVIFLATLLLVLGAISVVILVSFLLKILVMNPLEVGCKGFFLRNCDSPASLNEVVMGFHNWSRNVKTMFLKDLFVLLWGLLFLVPGIVKAYSYRLVPYLLADDPTMEGTDALKRSQALMMGHKRNVFVLDLSFLGWNILSAMTAGLLGVFYVNPYQQATNAELYRAILGKNSEKSGSAPEDSYAMNI